MGIERDEFEAWMRLLREDISGVHARLDQINGRTRTVETELAVLKAESPKDAKARWGAVGAGAAGLLGALYQWIQK